MSYGFTKDAGPTSRPLEQNPFTQFQFNQSLSPPSVTTLVFRPQTLRSSSSLTPSSVSGSSYVSRTVQSYDEGWLLAHTNDIDAEVAAPKPASFQLPKRTRSPPLKPGAADQAFQGNPYFHQLDTDEPSLSPPRPVSGSNFFSSTVPIHNQRRLLAHTNDIVGQPATSKLASFPLAKRARSPPLTSADQTFEEKSYLSQRDTDAMIIGLCPDMCPESEREERERKGDLDPYERLDGDRNQTSKFLAVKKYNRTAERDADLIRPMPILQKTVDYLLNLLDQAYDEKFLGTYNFLWDRMRAIRMDLRMQHIFNLEAIKMLEQMVSFLYLFRIAFIANYHFQL
ncbi:SAC3/GANP/THP3, conserved domain [Dillenia turbinata]|uniref:SAC3/GANP/THP3, conserved domain n=1 Tax=Dillenia turbinata TaxID=194707 RepID=A0AAN8V9K2_9MAGN